MKTRVDFFVTVLITFAIFMSFVSLQNVLLVFAQPTISDPNLKAELVVGGLSSPTSMAFLDNNNILLSEKGGNVRLVLNGQLQQEPVLQLSGVESNNERGLLGVAIMNNSNRQQAAVIQELAGVKTFFSMLQKTRHKQQVCRLMAKSEIESTVIDGMGIRSQIPNYF